MSFGDLCFRDIAPFPLNYGILGHWFVCHVPLLSNIGRASSDVSFLGKSVFFRGESGENGGVLLVVKTTSI